MSAWSSSWRSRAARMFGAIPGMADCRSPKRLGPSRSASTTSSVQRSPTAARAAESGVSASARPMPTSLDRRPDTVTCNSQVTRFTGRIAMSTLSDLQTTIAGVAERVGPSVVGLGRGWNAGSGVVIAPGRVATVAHAVRRGAPSVLLPDGNRADDVLFTADLDGNLAVLELDTGDAPVAELAEEPPGLGAPVVALADPGGRGLRATLGFVTSADRSVRGPRGRRIAGAIEHSAPLPRGSSGGPLTDADGRVIGLNAVRLDGGLILAVPLTSAAIERLSDPTRDEPRRLGIALAPAHVARRMRRAVGLPERDGLLVRRVADGSPAERAGLRRGDLIVSINGSEAERLDALHAALDSGAATIELGVVRGAEELSLTVSFEVVV